jgi:hypothetical protein
VPETLRFRDAKTSTQFSGNAVSFNGEIGLDEKDQHSLIVDHFSYRLLQKDSMVLFVGMHRNSGAKAEYKVEFEDYQLKRNPGRAWNPGAPVRFYGFPDEVVAYYQNADFVQELNLRHEMLFRSLSYLGPLRTKAERLYSWTGIEPESVGYAGEHTVAAILAAKKRRINFGPKRPTFPFEGVIARKLKEMELIEEFRVNPISEQRQEYEVKVRTKGSPDFVDLPDVGFGISQVLPVLVQCFYAPSNSIILMEQPEIHLHPRAQSLLADAMIDVINSRENGKPRNIQMIIETHSEHFLRRLQRRIAEDAVPQEKVAAYFANVSQHPATLEHLEIDEFGRIRNWPENFFSDEMEDITEQSKTAMGKRMERNEKKESSAE